MATIWQQRRGGIGVVQWPAFKRGPAATDFIRKKAEGKRDVIQRAVHGLTGATVAVALETSEHAKPAEQRTLTTDELIESVKRDFGAVEVEGESEN